MKSTTFTYKDQDGIDIFVYKWEPDNSQAKAVVQIAHGVAEHALRYQEFGEFLTTKGYVVYADDHRGHGKSIKDNNVGYIGETGWDGTVSAVHELTNIIKKENPNLPLFYYGMSWGSLLGQDIMQQWGSDYKGVIFAGTTGSANKLLLMVGSFLAKRAAKKDPYSPNKRLTEMNYKPFNKPWAKEPGATLFEWVTSVKEEMQKYIDDPLCGFISPASYFAQLIYGLRKIWNKSNERKIPTKLPFYFIAGQLDTVGEKNKTVKKLLKRYQSYGITDIEHKFYPNVRHDLLHETNRQEVYSDVVMWIDKKI